MRSQAFLLFLAWPATAAEPLDGFIDACLAPLPRPASAGLELVPEPTTDLGRAVMAREAEALVAWGEFQTLEPPTLWVQADEGAATGPDISMTIASGLRADGPALIWSCTLAEPRRASGQKAPDRMIRALDRALETLAPVRLTRVATATGGEARWRDPREERALQARYVYQIVKSGGHAFTVTRITRGEVTK